MQFHVGGYDILPIFVFFIFEIFSEYYFTA